MTTRPHVWMVIAAVALGGCAVKGKLDSRIGGGGKSAQQANEPPHRIQAPGPDDDHWEQREREQEARRQEHQYKDSPLKAEDLIVIEPRPGVAKVAAMKPTWCDLVSEPGSFNAGELGRALTQIKEQGWYWDRLGRIGTVLCVFPDDPMSQQQTAYWLQALVNISGMTAVEAAASVRARMAEDSWKTERQQHCGQLTVSEEASQEEKDYNAALRATYGCGHDGIPYWSGGGTHVDLEWHLDKDPEAPSEVLRAYHVLRCLGRPGDKLTPDELARYALCGVEARDLDAQKVDRELKKAGANGYARTVAREHHARARQVAGHFERLARAEAQKEKAYARLLFEVPDAAWRGWVEQYRANRKAIQAANDYEAVYFGPSRRAAQGCSGALRANYQAYFQGKRPRDLDQAKAAAADTIGMSLLTRLILCEAAEGNLHQAFMLFELVREGRPARGPRFAVYYAVMDELSEIRADRNRFPIEHAMLGHRGIGALGNAYMLWGNKVMLDEATTGVVRSVTPAGDGVTVQFTTTKHREAVYRCTPTRRVRSIDSAGQLHYWHDCVQTGTKVVSKTHPTIWVPKAYAHGIRPGVMIGFRADLADRHASGERHGIVTEVWADQNQKKLLAYFGLGL